MNHFMKTVVHEVVHWFMKHQGMSVPVGENGRASYLAEEKKAKKLTDQLKGKIKHERRMKL